MKRQNTRFMQSIFVVVPEDCNDLQKSRSTIRSTLNETLNETRFVQEMFQLYAPRIATTYNNPFKRFWAFERSLERIVERNFHKGHLRNTLQESVQAFVQEPFFPIYKYIDKKVGT